MSTDKTREYNRRYYLSSRGRATMARHRLSTRERTARLRLGRKQMLDDLKAKTPCADCGEQLHPCMMEFDHLPEFRKVKAVTSLTTSTMEALLAELAKCEVVCANCHRVRTWLRKDPSRQDPRLQFGLGTDE